MSTSIPFTTSDLSLAALLRCAGIEPDTIAPVAGRARYVEFRYPRSPRLAAALDKWIAGTLTTSEPELTQSRDVLRAKAVLALAAVQPQGGRP